MTKKYLAAGLFVLIFFAGCGKRMVLDTAPVAENIHFDIEEIETFKQGDASDIDKNELLTKISSSSENRNSKKKELCYDIHFMSGVSFLEQPIIDDSEYLMVIDRQEEDGRVLASCKNTTFSSDESAKDETVETDYFKEGDNYYSRYNTSKSTYDLIYETYNNKENVLNLDSLGVWKKSEQESIPEWVSNDFASVNYSDDRLVLDEKTYFDKNGKTYFVLKGEVPLNEINTLISNNIFMEILDNQYIDFLMDGNAKVWSFIERDNPANITTYISIGNISGILKRPASSESEIQEFNSSDLDDSSQSFSKEDTISVDIKKYIIRIKDCEADRTIPHEKEIM